MNASLPVLGNVRVHTSPMDSPLLLSMIAIFKGQPPVPPQLTQFEGQMAYIPPPPTPAPIPAPGNAVP